MNGAETENTWYVAVMRAGGRHYSFTGAGSSSYRGFSEHSRASGIEIVAERFDVTDPEINRLTGFDETGQRTKENLLKALTDSLDKNGGLSPQAALDGLF